MTKEEIIRMAESVSMNLVIRSDESTLVEFAELVAQQAIAEALIGGSELNAGLGADLERELRAAINPVYEDVRGTESFGRKRMLGEIDRLRELCRDSYHEMNCGDTGDVFERTHHCGRCDSSIDRNGTLRGKLAMAFVMVPNLNSKTSEN